MIPNDIFDTLIGSLAIAAVKATHVTDGDEQTRQLIRIKAARDYLEQLQTQPVYEPVEDGLIDDGLIDDDTRIMDNGTVIWQVINFFGEEIDSMVYLTDNIRLCRLVQQQPQEGQSHDTE